MTKPLIKTWLNAHLHVKTLYTSELPSETIPDQTMSIKELLQKYSRGQPITGDNREPQYEEENHNFLDYKKLDLSEIEDLKLQTQHEITQLEAKAKNELIEKRAKAKKAVEQQRHENTPTPPENKPIEETISK